MSASFAARLARLTPRERQVLQLVTEGMTQPSVARRLELSDGQVRVAVATIRRKLAAPRSAPLRDLVLADDELRAALHVPLPERAGPVVDVRDSRRARHVLRLTLAELTSLAQRSRLRTATLADLPGHDAETEASQRITELLEEVLSNALDEARRVP